MVKTNELFQPSLENGWKETKTYEINRLFLVAFFGGTIPTIILGTRNARWLNVPKKYINLLIVLGVLFTIFDFGLFYFYTQGDFSPDSRPLIKFGLKLSAIILFFLYKLVLNKPFQQHMVIDGEITPILKPAILWIVIGGIIEFIAMTTAFTIVD